MTAERIIIRVKRARPYGWHVVMDGWTVGFYRTKANAEHYAANLARALEPLPSQVVVHKKNGQIELEWTYPRSSDPEKSLG